jgi:RNase adaptor protein for sRNA GlmZ degradation
MSTEVLIGVAPSILVPSITISLFSYGHANGPIIQPPSHSRRHKILAYNIRHLPNPPRHLRVNSTGLSRRLQKELLQNDNVEAFLVKVQNELVTSIKTECDLFLHSTEINEQEPKDLHESSHITEQVALDCPDIDMVVTICCEEGRHRSVAFVEELARRLATFRNGDSSSQLWQLSVNVTHRDIGDPIDLEQSSGQQKRPNKAQAKSRQKERREKGEKFRSQLGDHDEEG